MVLIPYKTFGYGSKFNEIFIDKNKKIFIKKSKNIDEGLNKIQNEILFYKYIFSNQIKFNLANFYYGCHNGYIIKYYDNYINLSLIFYKLNFEQKNLIINVILNNINNLHNFEKKQVNKNKYIENVIEEIYNKNIFRYNKFKNFFDEYANIKFVNQLEIYKYDDLLDKIKNLCLNEINNFKQYFFVLIHGDCQFNNILIKKNYDDIIFIDPKAQFGKIKLYGILEYDYAKLLMSIYGYGKFDLVETLNIDIVSNNITINSEYVNINDTFYFIEKQDKLTVLIMISIWMGNFYGYANINNNKMLNSYFISLYLGTCLLNKLFL